LKAIRVYRFGGPEVLVFEDLARPVPGRGEVLVRVEAAGVAPWDAWIRSGHSALPQPLPLTPGSDVAGVVEETGSGVPGFRRGDEIYGVTNPQFTGGYAQFAVMSAAMIALKPRTLNFIEAASVPVISVTAWQMLFERAKVQPGQRVLILGSSGSVGSMAVQLASQHGAHTIAEVSSDGGQRARKLGAHELLDLRNAVQVQALEPVDAVIDAAGGEKQRAAISKLRRGGILISAVSAPDPVLLAEQGAEGAFFLVNTTTDRLRQIAALIDSGTLSTRVGTVLPLPEAILAHQMLDGARPYARGKIVLQAEDSVS
jgi:NADPH:quinone reductase-like Zn-dependent oxidoreductase